VLRHSFVIRYSCFVIPELSSSVKLATIPAPDFDLKKTLDSGQVFHWEKVGDGFVGAIGDLPVHVRQDGRALKVRFGEPPTLRNRAPEWSRVTALDPSGGDCDSFRKPVMNAARDFCLGLRIIRQPKWECLATFICSSMKRGTHSPSCWRPETIWRATEDRRSPYTFASRGSALPEGVARL
jgi:hypothetical protein